MTELIGGRAKPLRPYQRVQGHETVSENVAITHIDKPLELSYSIHFQAQQLAARSGLSA